MQKKLQFSLWYFVFALFAIFTLHDLWVQMRTVEPVPYSEFQRMVKDGEVSEIAITDNAIQGTLKKPLDDGRQKFVTTRVDPALAKDLSQYDVKFTGIVENTLLRDILGWVLPAVIFVGIWIFAMRKFAGKQGMGGNAVQLALNGIFICIPSYCKHEERLLTSGSNAVELASCPLRTSPLSRS